MSIDLLIGREVLKVGVSLPKNGPFFRREVQPPTRIQNPSIIDPARSPSQVIGLLPEKHGGRDAERERIEPGEGEAEDEDRMLRTRNP